MAIPKYDEIMLPLLKALSDGAEYKKRELIEKMADAFGLDQEERELMLPSVRSTYIQNRTGWAGFHLRKAGLATSPREATLQITDDGRKFLNLQKLVTGRVPPVGGPSWKVISLNG